ncbi:hypothetical protein SDC9_182672 [bioreactor metagenome]|uniref:Uncharacterized protein n=1 Tax=bioreactor metagenome TaxID=1076179 RepID=A0A645H818_9ZZZZ
MNWSYQNISLSDGLLGQRLIITLSAEIAALRFYITLNAFVKFEFDCFIVYVIIPQFKSQANKIGVA